MMSATEVRGDRGRGLSIKYRLPLIIGTFLLVGILALSAAAYMEMRAAVSAAAGQRLLALTGQFRDLFEQSATQLRAQMAVVGNDGPLADYIRAPQVGDRARALAALDVSGGQRDQVIATEVRDSNGVVLLSTASGPGPDAASAREVRPSRLETADSVVIGRFHARGDTIIYATGARLSGVENAYVVRWRRLIGSRRAREQLTRLVGSGATVMIGNPDGTTWTDLEHSIAAPSLDTSARSLVRSYTRGSPPVRYLGTASAIPGTPWLLAVDFPMATVLAPVGSFLWRIALVAAIALGPGLWAAWVVSHRLTIPIVQLTSAADAIGRGEYPGIVSIDRTDEIGRLGSSFGSMAEEIRSSRVALQEKVDERTRDLHDTLHQLRDAQDSLVRRERLAMLGQLASGVGHELRNPLGVMTNALYYLRAVLESPPDNVREYLDILQQQVTLSEKIVSDLLDFARSKPPQRSAARLPAIATAQIERLGGTNGVRIVADLPEDLPPVLVDRTHVGQIILNLLTNATQAIEGTGLVAIRARHVGDRVYVDVQDSGCGVATENTEKIFEPLFTTRARGIGLGLAVSRTLARANGGELALLDGASPGATFRLTLAVATPEAR